MYVDVGRIQRRGIVLRIVSGENTKVSFLRLFGIQRRGMKLCLVVMLTNSIFRDLGPVAMIILSSV